MNTLRDYVDWKLTHSDKTAEAEGYPLVLENCKRNKRMKDLKVYGNSVQNGTPTPENPVEVQSVGVKTRNLFDKDNCVMQHSYVAGTITPTNTGVSFKVSSNATSTTHPYVSLKIGLASEFAGKTLIFSSTSFYNNAARLSVRKGINGVQYGRGFTKSGEVYYSTITVEEKEYTDEVLVIMLYALQGTAPETIVTYDNIMVNEGSEILPYEPYGYKIPIVQRGENTEPVIHNVYLEKPLANGEMLDVKEYIQLPKITSKTTVFTVDSTVEPSNMYGKYIK